MYYFVNVIGALRSWPGYRDNICVQDHSEI